MPPPDLARLRSLIEEGRGFAGAASAWRPDAPPDRKIVEGYADRLQRAIVAFEVDPAWRDGDGEPTGSGPVGFHLAGLVEVFGRMMARGSLVLVSGVWRLGPDGRATLALGEFEYRRLIDSLDGLSRGLKMTPIDGLRLEDAGQKCRAVLWRVARTDSNRPDNQNGKGTTNSAHESEESSESDSNPRTRDFGSHTDVITLPNNMKRDWDGSGRPSSDSSDSCLGDPDEDREVGTL